MKRFRFVEWNNRDGMGDIQADNMTGPYCLYSDFEALQIAAAHIQNQLNEAHGRIKELEHSLKVEREEVKRHKQTNGAGRWL